MNEKIDVSNCTFYVEGECDIHQDNCDKVDCRYKWYKRLEVENAKLKEKLEKIKEILSFCYSEEGTEIPCIDCKYYKECGIQPIDYVIKIIEGAEDE